MTRYNWAGALGASVAIAALAGGGVGIHEFSIHSRTHEIAAKKNENAYIRMVAGDEQLHGAPGHLARFVQPALNKDNPVKALIKVYVPEVEFNDVNAIIYTDVVPVTSENSSGAGPLSPEFILLTLQAKDNPEDVILKVPEPKARGPWQWGTAGILVVIPWLILLFLQPVYRSREWIRARRRRRERAAYQASLTPTARAVLKIKEELEATKPVLDYNLGSYFDFEDRLREWESGPEGKAYEKADAALQLATEGWTNAEQKYRLKQLAGELDLIIGSEKEGQQKYDEL